MHRLQCIDEPLKLYGDWNTATAQVLFFAFHPCDKKTRDTCKSPKEINEWLGNKYMLIAYNKYVFEQDGFKERTFTKFAYLDWIAYDTYTPRITPISIEITELITDDNYFPSRSHNQTYFEFVQGTSFPYNYLGTNGIMVQMSPDKNIIERKVYSLEDLSNEIGGFVEFVVMPFYLLVPFFKIWSIDKYLVTKLYKSQDAEND